MYTLLLYSTSGCHLCELAERVLRDVQANLSSNDKNFRVKKIDITDDSELFERYGVRIPVVKVDGQSQDLGWPFDTNDFKNYLLMASHLA